jgi:hypothetical protein
MGKVSLELLHLDRVYAVPDQEVGEEIPCVLEVQALALAGHYAEHIKLRKQLYGQHWWASYFYKVTVKRN